MAETTPGQPQPQPQPTNNNNNSKRKGFVDVELDDGSVMEIMPIGAGSEVGRSCIIVKFKGKQVMLDCGIHPAHAGIPALPFFDAIDTKEIDLCLISHFHLDHAAAIPYLTEKTPFKGGVYMTHPTKAIFTLLLADYVKVSHHLEDMLYDEADLNRCLEKIKRINYHQEVVHEGIKFHCYNAGHVLGACMFMFEIAGVKVLYTGDFSKYDDRHLVGAETPPFSPDVLIVESTYGVQVHEPRKEREQRFTSFVHDTVMRGGRCLIPVFALGRAQELLLILEEHWKKNPELHKIRIYYASSLAKRCMTVFQAYINMMNKKIQEEFEVSNPFVFDYISNLKSADHFQDTGPVVVMASPAMLQSGLSRELFERWASNSKNGVIIPGYCVQGTLAKTVMSEPEMVTTTDGREIEFKMKVAYTSFSAHSDFNQTSEFVRDTKPKHIVLVHGDGTEMRRLRDRLLNKIDSELEIHTPKNCTSVQLRFHRDKVAKVVGSLAQPQLQKGDAVAGILISKDFDSSILSASELGQYTNLHNNVVLQKQFVTFRSTFGLLVHLVEQVYDDCVVDVEMGSLKVHGQVTVTVVKKEKLRERQLRSAGDVVGVEWESGPEPDMIADSILTLLLQMESNPALLQTNIKEFENVSGQDSDAQAKSVVFDVLHNFYGEAVTVEDSGTFRVVVDGQVVRIDHKGQILECGKTETGEAVAAVVRNVSRALFPLQKP